VQTASDDLRNHARRRNVVFLELLACLAAGVALWEILGRIEMALPEAQTVCLTVSMAFGFAFARFLAELIPVLAYRCPRCDGRFHANASRAALRVRTCAHCGLSPGSPADPSGPAEAPPHS
jgi:hypothetical protein